MPTVKQTTSHLRLHQPSVTGNPGRHHGGTSILTGGDPIEQFWSVFSSTTGWRIDAQRRRRGGEVAVIPSVRSHLELDPLHDDSELAIAPDGGIDRDTAGRLAAAATGVTAELLAARKQMLRSETELAARAMMFGGSEDCDNVADRIVQHLSDAVAATGTTAAALYLLDDDTESLRISATHGLSPMAMTTPPRPLRGSRGDLEALVNHVVLADSFTSGGIDSFSPPALSGTECFAGGICVSIRSGDLPIGTLWLLHDSTVQYGNAQSAAARLSASAIELELKVSIRSSPAEPVTGPSAKLATPFARVSTVSDSPSVKSKTGSHRLLFAADPESPAETLVRQIAQWQFLSLPQGSKLADNWYVDGMIESPADWVSGWHTWDLLPDGTMMIALAELDPSATIDAIASSVARSALQSHTLYRHNPAEMLRRVSDTLWQTGSIQTELSMIYAQIDPETGHGEFAAAGAVHAIVGNRYGFRPLANGNSPAIGQHIDPQFSNQSFRLLPGETLLGYDSGMMLDKSIGQSDLGQCLRQSAIDSSKYPLSLIRRRIASSPLSRQRGAISLARTR